MFSEFFAKFLEGAQRVVGRVLGLFGKRPQRSAKASRFSTRKRPSAKEHVHQELQPRKGVVEKALAFENQAEPLCRYLHDHAEYVPVSVLREVGLDRPVVFIHDTLYFRDNHFVSFSPRKHSHPEYMEKRTIGRGFSIADASELAHSVAVQHHEHEGAVPVNTDVPLARCGFPYTPASVGHAHANLELYGRYKLRKSGVAQSADKRAVLIVGKFSGKAVANKQVTFRLPLMDSLRFLPDDMIAMQLVLKRPTTFFTYFKDALVDFYDSFRQASGDFSHLFEEKFYMRPVEENLLMQVLKFVVSFGTYAPIAPAEKIVVYKKHFSRFANSVILRTTESIPSGITVQSWATEVPDIEQFKQEIEKWNRALDYCERLMRQLEDIEPDQEFNYPLSGLFAPGQMLVRREAGANVLEIRHGGFPYSVLVFGGG